MFCIHNLNDKGESQNEKACLCMGMCIACRKAAFDRLPEQRRYVHIGAVCRCRDNHGNRG